MILVVMFQPLWLCILYVHFTKDVSHCEAPDARSFRFYLTGDQAVVVPQQLGNLRMNGVHSQRQSGACWAVVASWFRRRGPELSVK